MRGGCRDCLSIAESRGGCGSLISCHKIPVQLLADWQASIMYITHTDMFSLQVIFSCFGLLLFSEETRVVFLVDYNK